MREYRRKRNIDVIDDNVTELSNHNDSKRKKGIIFESICKSIGKRKQVMLK